MERTKEEIKAYLEEASREMYESMRDGNLDNDDKAEWWGYIRAIRDVSHFLCYEAVESTQRDVENGLQIILKRNK